MIKVYAGLEREVFISERYSRASSQNYSGTKHFVLTQRIPSKVAANIFLYLLFLKCFRSSFVKGVLWFLPSNHREEPRANISQSRFKCVQNPQPRREQRKDSPSLTATFITFLSALVLPPPSGCVCSTLIHLAKTLPQQQDRDTWTKLRPAEHSKLSSIVAGSRQPHILMQGKQTLS